MTAELHAAILERKELSHADLLDYLGIPIEHKNAIRLWRGKPPQEWYRGSAYDKFFEYKHGGKGMARQADHIFEVFPSIEVEDTPDVPCESVTVIKGNDDYDPVETGRLAYERIMQESADYLSDKRDKKPEEIEIEIETDVPIALCNMSDLHLGTVNVDHVRAYEDAQLIRRTRGAYAVFGGDGLSNHIKHKAHMINREGVPPKKQFAMLEFYLSQFDGKLLAGVTGNHEFWTKHYAGYDLVRDIMNRQGVQYNPHEVKLTLYINGIEYRIFLRHNYRFKSSINLSNQFLRMWEQGGWDFDIGLVGHTHDGPFVCNFMRHGKERWGGLAGSYQVIDDHSKQWGFTDAEPTTPVFILDNEEYHVSAHTDLRKGIEALSALREHRSRHKTKRRITV